MEETQAVHLQLVVAHKQFQHAKFHVDQFTNKLKVAKRKTKRQVSRRFSAGPSPLRMRVCVKENRKSMCLRMRACKLEVLELQYELACLKEEEMETPTNPDQEHRLN